MEQYITTQGDAWDSIAYKLFIDEAFALDIMQVNQDYLDILIFEAGVVLQIPKITKKTKNLDLPIWMQ